MADVFISYSSLDKPAADKVCHFLESKRIRCWIAPRDILPGAEWGGAIIDGIGGASVMVLLFSSHSNGSKQVMREVERAVHKGIPIIPLRIEKTLPSANLEYFISASHWLDAVGGPSDEHLHKLADTIQHLLASNQVAPPTHAVAKDLPLSQPAASPAVPAPRARRNPLPLALAAFLLTAAAGYFAYLQFSSGSERPGPTSAPSAASKPAASSLPTLLTATAPAEPQWQPFFNEKNFDEFFARRGAQPQGWQIQDGGVLVAATGNERLLSVRQYVNFEFDCEVKLIRGGWAMIIYRCHAAPVQQNAPMIALGAGERVDSVDPRNTPGAIHSFLAADMPTAMKGGQWHRVRIAAINDHIQHFINDVKVLDVTVGSERWNNARSTSLINNLSSDFGKPIPGSIGFQGTNCLFRNVKIRVLPSAATQAAAPR